MAHHVGHGELIVCLDELPTVSLSIPTPVLETHRSSVAQQDVERGWGQIKRAGWGQSYTLTARRFPRGEGVEHDLLMLEEVTVSLITERRGSRPWGPRAGTGSSPGAARAGPGRLPDKVTLDLQARRRGQAVDPWRRRLSPASSWTGGSISTDLIPLLNKV